MIEYKKSSLSTGVLRILLAFILFSILLFILVNMKSQTTHSAGNVIVKILLVLIIIYAIYGVILGIIEIFSRKDWLVRISKDHFIYQTPHQKIGDSFCLKNKNIKKLIIEEISDLEYTHYRYYIVDNGNRLYIYDEACGLAFESLAEEINKHNPGIKLVRKKT